MGLGVDIDVVMNAWVGKGIIHYDFVDCSLGVLGESGWSGGMMLG